MNDKNVIAHIRNSQMGIRQIESSAEGLTAKRIKEQYPKQVEEEIDVDREQELREHLYSVSTLAGRFADKIGMEYCGKLIGLLHDIGKASESFQQYIREVSDNENTARGKVDHATAGARLLYEYYYLRFVNGEGDQNQGEQENQIQNQSQDQNRLRMRLLEILENAMVSHHSGLYSFYSLEHSAMMDRRLLKDKKEMHYAEATAYLFTHIISKEELDRWVGEALKEFESFVSEEDDDSEMTFVFLLKYLYSCLIDADYLDSFLFEEGKKMGDLSEHELGGALFERAYLELMSALDVKKNQEGKLNQIRREISDLVDARANESGGGIMTLSMPTGSGKTLTAMRYALKHSLIAKKQKIYYITNFLAVIEQNVQVIRETIPCLNEHILEFHSNVLNSMGGDDEPGDAKGSAETEQDYIWRKKQSRLLQQRFDSPIIFTSLVQFLNIFFGGKRYYRRLHQFANSVFIFDEIQSVPSYVVLLLCQAVNFLTRINSTVILSTATQPYFQKLEHGFEIPETTKSELVPNVSDYFEPFRRHRIVYHPDPFYTYEEVADFLNEQLEGCNSLLMITNTIQSARGIFNILKNNSEYECYNLSTALCPAHRKEKIRNLRNSLKALRETGGVSGSEKENYPEVERKKVVCISTPIIEAGVDISFETAVRSVSGLDSIAQAAGRCNREKERPYGQIHIVRLGAELERMTNLKEVEEKQNVSLDILRPCKEIDNLFHPQNLETYFTRLHKKQKEVYRFPIPEKTSFGSMLRGLTVFDILNSNRVAVGEAQKAGNTLCINRSDIRMAEKVFYVIPNKGVQVLVPYRCAEVDGNEIINGLLSNCSLTEKYKLLKQAQQITISLFDHVFYQLNQRNLVYEVPEIEGLYYLDASYYSEEIGFIGLDGVPELTYLGI